MRHTKGHSANRRSHHHVVAPRLGKCTNCGELHLRHRLCLNCGTYRGREVVDVLAKLSKKERKEKAKELEAQGGEAKPLSAAELSKK